MYQHVLLIEGFGQHYFIFNAVCCEAFHTFYLKFYILNVQLVFLSVAKRIRCIIS